MGYQLLGQLGPDSLKFSDDTGGTVVFDRIPFVMTPRESVRKELQQEIREIVKAEAAVRHKKLLRYEGLEKHQAQLYLVRKRGPEASAVPLATDDLAQIGQALGTALEVLEAYHAQGIILGRLSPGMIRVDPSGEIWVSDPPLFNHFGTALDDAFHSLPAPEEIAGRPRTGQTDSFAWGYLAYRLLTGTDPFHSEDAAERIDKITRGSLVPVRDLRPEAGAELSRLVEAALRVEPEERPSVEQLRRGLAAIMERGTYRSDEAEVLAYREKSAANLRRYQTRERLWFWWRKYGVALGVTLVLLIGAIFMFRPQTQPTLTRETKPAAVIGYYFDSIQRVDLPLLAETIHKAKHSFEDLVTNMHVINKTQQGVAMTTRYNGKLVIEGLTVKPLRETPAEARYEIGYTLKIILPRETQVITRLDRFTLKPVREIWRITDIQILKQDQRVDPVESAPPIPEPESLQKP